MTELFQRHHLYPLLGWLMFSAVLLSVAQGLGWLPGYWAGAAAWSAGLVLFHRVGGVLRIQVLVIMTIGCIAVAWGVSGQQPVEPPWQRLLAVNHSLIAMLMAVSFLRLVTAFKVSTDERLPTGRRALWRTLLGVNLFGAVINMSTLVIVGERMSQRVPLSPLQAMLLSRGFALAALWSPFFVAMGVALTHAEGAGLVTLSLAGIPVAVVALLLAGLSLGRHPAALHTSGYPIHFDALWLPALLALLVLIARLLWPQVPILSWVSLLSVLLCVVVMGLREKGAGIQSVRRHIEQQLPQMGGELSLFLAAGVLSVGLALVVERTGFDWPLATFGPWQAWLLLLLIVAAAVIGIHPLISIATSGGILAGQVSDPNLLGMTYLMGWALGIMASPLSGTHLTLQARFGVPAHRFFGWNLGFVVQMLALNLLALQGYSWWAG